MTPADRAALAAIGIHIALACNEDDEALRTAALDEAMRRIKVLARRKSGRCGAGVTSLSMCREAGAWSWMPVR